MLRQSLDPCLTSPCLGGNLLRPANPTPIMKLKVSNSKSKRLKKVGFRTRSKTAAGRKIIKRKIARSGKFRVG